MTVGNNKVVFTDPCPRITGAKLVITERPMDEGGTGPAIYDAHIRMGSGKGALVASCSQPRRLSEALFSAGAWEVEHRYNLVSEHARFHRG